MAGGKAPPKSSSGTTRSNALLPSSHHPPHRARQLQALIGHIPTVPSTGIHSLPIDRVQQLNRVLLNKVILCFESEFSKQPVENWLRIYDQKKSTLHLTLFDELPNALFVVQFDAINLEAAKQSLLEASPLWAGET